MDQIAKPGAACAGLWLLGSPLNLSQGIGGVAQLGERVLCKHEVVGSIPSASTKLRLCVELVGSGGDISMRSNRSVAGSPVTVGSKGCRFLNIVKMVL